MKAKILTYVLAGVLLVFGVYAYNYPPSSKINIKNGSICKDYRKKPISELEVRLVHEMVNGYRKDKKQLFHINGGMTFPGPSGFTKRDAESIWFDFETLQAFLFHMENEATKRGTDSDELGVRIYYANYPEDQMFWDKTKTTDLQGVSLDYKKRHTLVCIPTIRRDGLNMNFNPTDKRTYTQSFESLPDYSDLNSTFKTAAFGLKSNDPGGSTGAQNHGNLYPPDL